MSLTKQNLDEINERFPVDDEQREPFINNETDFLKSRVIEVKKKLPRAIVPLFISKFPDFDTYKKRSRLANVIHLKIADQDITEKLEKLSEILAPENK